MAREVGADSFTLDLSFLIGEYENRLAAASDEEGKKRIGQLLDACRLMDGKSLMELLLLVDTGAFNNIISAYCVRAMSDLGKGEEECQEVLDKLAELYDLDAEEVVIPQLTIETEDEE